MELDRFLDYLKTEKKTSSNTVEAYRRDMLEFERYMKTRIINRFEAVTNTEVIGYLLALKNEGKSTATINRKISSLRTFFVYLQDNGLIASNPVSGIKAPKIKRREIEYISVDEMNTLLEVPMKDSPIGKRDKALLELLYATGARASEVIDANIEDVNLRMGFITFNGQHGRARIVPLGHISKDALAEYILNARDFLLKNCKDCEDGAPLFLNYMGKRISRQGMWKVIREYGKKAGLQKEITPQIIRHSFAVHMVENGADIKSLQELMGHEDISATEIYMTVRKNRIKDVYDSAHPRA